ncbi:EXLDI protein [Sporolactobacillus shoreicorticis]|uniref:EXLDI protein n=1 Tax=Sporolactobacillus shoreicorticis TaxID=1923877 RepID=A0ABW5S745_9BACL|nr:EXLDI protein [Sporolactobacillus shoreicorticis]MCO7125746.1 EXLDI protein [Sporolactobacillus shoreicorticis]
MPNKTIYVPDADLEVFDQAQEVSGKNLSATIVQALRFYTKIGEGKGFEHIEVSEGENGFYKRKRFIGRELASASVHDEDHSLLTTYVVYETTHGRYAVLIREQKRIPLEQSIENELKKRIMEKIAGENMNRIPFQKESEDDSPDLRKLEIFNSIDDLVGHVPSDLYRALHEIKDGEFLDI